VYKRIFLKGVIIFMICLGLNNNLYVNASLSLAGNGTSSSPYLITNQADLINLSSAVAAGYDTHGKYFLLANDIHLTTAINPIGTPANPFMGIFYSVAGSPKSIHNLTINTNSDYSALFSFVFGARIENINLVNVNISGGDLTAGLVSHAVLTEIRNVSVSGNIIGGYIVGGIAAIVEDTQIINSRSIANISGGSMVGGFISVMMGADSLIQSSFFYGDVNSYRTSSDFVAGGFLVILDDGIIEESFSYASINSPVQINQVGGFASNITGGIIRNSYASGKIDANYSAGFVYNFVSGMIENSYSSVRVSGNASYSGFVSHEDDLATFVNNYFDGSINEDSLTSTNENIEGITMLTSFEMTVGAREHMLGFSETTWNFSQGSNTKFYPRLRVFNNSHHSQSSAEFGVYYSVRFMIPFDMETPDIGLINQLVTLGQNILAPTLMGVDSELFVGWSRTENSTVAEFLGNQIRNISENLVLYPVFSQRQTFRIIYTNLNADGGRAPIDENEYKESDIAVIMPNEGHLFRALHEFEGWRCDEGRLYRIGETITITGSLRLNPSWRSTAPTPPPQIINNFLQNANSNNSEDSFLRLAELLGELSIINSQNIDNRVRIETEISLNRIETARETRTEMFVRFSLDVPLEFLRR